MAERTVDKRRRGQGLVARGDASAASTLEAACLIRHPEPSCVCRRPGEDYALRGTSRSHRGHMPKGYRHLTYDKRCQIYALLKSGCAKTRDCTVDRRASFDNHEGTQTQYRRQGVSLHTGAGESGRQARRRIGCAAQNEARPRPRDRGKVTDARTMEPRSNQRLVEKAGTRLCQLRTHLPAHSWKDKRNGGDLWRHLRRSRARNTAGAKAETPGAA